MKYNILCSINGANGFFRGYSKAKCNFLTLRPNFKQNRNILDVISFYRFSKEIAEVFISHFLKNSGKINS